MFTRTETKEPAQASGLGYKAAYLVLSLESERLRAPPSRYGLHGISEVSIGRHARRYCRERERPGCRALRIGVPDRWLSANHVLMRRDEDHGWTVSDGGSKAGTFVNGTRIESQRLVDGDLIDAGRTLFVFRDQVEGQPGEPLTLDAEQMRGPPALATLNPELRTAFRALRTVAATAGAVLITGETGTGKELTAQAIHMVSLRNGPLVAVNCGGIAPAPIERQLLGHKRGAVSGASKDSPGLIVAADQGTLFLDEIAELTLGAQAALLPVLEAQAVRAVGAATARPVDVRVVAATSQDLAARIEAGTVRLDLYARVAEHTLALPPLRERREDIGWLVVRLLERDFPSASLTIEIEAARTLHRYWWPRNVRQLRGALNAAIAVAEDGRIRLDDLPKELLKSHPGSSLTAADDALRARLVALMREHHGNVSSVARAMGKARSKIYGWLERFDIDIKTYRRR